MRQSINISGKRKYTELGTIKTTRNVTKFCGKMNPTNQVYSLEKSLSILTNSLEDKNGKSSHF